MKKIVLASTSPRRLELLEELGFEVEVRVPDVDETPMPGESARTLVERLAIAKAGSVKRALGETLIAADTVVVLADRVLGKPESDAHARRMLDALSGRTHRVVGGFCILGDGLSRSQVVTTEVRFRSLSEAEIEDYVATGEPRDKAGAYGIQGLGAALVEAVEGSFHNVVGLPTEEVLAVLRELGA